MKKVVHQKLYTQKNDIWRITRNWFKSTAQAKQVLAGGYY